VRSLRPTQTVTFKAKRRLRWTASIEPGLLDARPSTHPKLFGDLDASRRRFLLLDETVANVYGDRILAQLHRYGVVHNEPFLLAGGEQAKSQKVVEDIQRAMEAWGIQRLNEPLLIWGGGSLHDVGGLAAATYRREVPYIMFGTTLVAAIDAMFALKVAINEFYKSRIGSYHPPLAANCDPAFFTSLPPAQILEGIAELFKAGVCMRARVFRALEAHGRRAVDEKFQGTDAGTLGITRHGLAAMARELSRNAYEGNPRRASYGGHDISAAMEPHVTHGTAVGLNLLWSTMVSCRRRRISPQRRDRIVALAADLGLARWHPVLENVDRLVEALDDVALHRRGNQLVAAPGRRLGRAVYLNNITPDELVQGLDDMRAFAA
jgi:3-dehydroquinate synthetase